MTTTTLAPTTSQDALDYGAVMGMGSGDQSGSHVLEQFLGCSQQPLNSWFVVAFAEVVVTTTTTTTTTTAAPTTRQDAMDYGAVMGMGSGDQSGEKFTYFETFFRLLPAASEFLIY